MLFQTDWSSSHPACLTSGIQAGETHQQLQLARDQSSERSGPRDALEDARGAGWESRAVPRRRRAPAGNADSPTTPAGVVRRRAGGRRQAYPGWRKVLGRRRPPCSEGSRAQAAKRWSDSTLRGSFQAPARRVESAPLGQPLPRPRSLGRSVTEIPGLAILKASARKGLGRVLPSGERSSDRPPDPPFGGSAGFSAAHGEKPPLRQETCRRRRALAPKTAVRNPFSLGGFACHRELPWAARPDVNFKYGRGARSPVFQP